MTTTKKKKPTKKKKRPTPRNLGGRPSLSGSGETTVRQIGRVPQDEWDTMRAAAKRSSETFSAFARRVLLRESMKVLQT